MQHRAVSRYDIFVCAHSGAFGAARSLLKVLRPFGTLHLVSSHLLPNEVRVLEPWFDDLHEPAHHPDGYRNFNLFCIRDLHRIARARHFIKVDTDVVLSANWIRYVDETLGLFPGAVLFGSHAGTNPIDYRIEGDLVNRLLGGPVRVRAGRKVNGSFYVGQTEFFQRHDRLAQVLHESLYAFAGGRRIRETTLLPSQSAVGDRCPEEVRLRGSCRGKEGSCIEDELRSLVVHAAGASADLFVRDSDGKITLPDKVHRPSRLKLAVKELKLRLGVPVYDNGEHAA